MDDGGMEERWRDKWRWWDGRTVEGQREMTEERKLQEGRKDRSKMKGKRVIEMEVRKKSEKERKKER